MELVLKAFSLRDSKGEVFNPPFYKGTQGEAERDFQTLVNDKNSTVNQYPDDFDLYFVGTFDTRSGKFEPIATPQHLIKAVQLMRREHRPELAQ